VDPYLLEFIGKNNKNKPPKKENDDITNPLRHKGNKIFPFQTSSVVRSQESNDFYGRN
jgi:hypothetical protein